MQTYQIGERMSDEDSLAHYGVKGMRWGHRSARPDSSGVSRQDVRAARRQNNKTTTRKLEDWNDDTGGFKNRHDRNDQIKAARKGLKQANRDYKDARQDIKAQKKAGTLGKNAAKIALNKAANTHWETAYKAQQHTSGEAAVKLILGATQVALR